MDDDRRDAAAGAVPLVLVVHRLVGDAYDVVGRFDDEVRLDEPVSVSFRLVSLLA